MRPALCVARLGAVIAAGPACAAGTEELTPKRAGTLTCMIPPDAPPSLDPHREASYAMIRKVAPFDSVLMRVLDTEARPMLWRHRELPERSYVHGWNIGPSHASSHDRSNIWLDETPNG